MSCTEYRASDNALLTENAELEQELARKKAEQTGSKETIRREQQQIR